MVSVVAEKAQDSSPSMLGGIMIIAATAVGAGMFSLPVVSAGMWFSWSLVALFFTWFCMFHSGLMILETNLNYPVGSSFDTFTKDTLGPVWNAINGLTVAFVLYILTYAYISGGGSIVSHTLKTAVDMALPPKLAGLIFALCLACIVWFSTALVSRIATILIGGMIITFAISVGDMSTNIRMTVLFDVEKNGPGYLPFVLAALPFYLTSFGFHGNVPSLMKYYGKDPAKIKKCLLYGSLMSLSVYVIWQCTALGNISRFEFRQIIADGGNIGVLVAALSQATNSQSMSMLLNVFTNLAVVSSFLGVTLGLFDFIADKFKFDDSHFGRFKTALATFGPPTIGGVFFPDGFIYAIGFAGLAATVWGAIIPALMAKVSRERFGNPLFRVWGGNGLIYLIIAFGIVYAVCHILAMAGLLPVYG